MLFFFFWQEKRESAPILTEVQGRVLEVTTAESQGLNGRAVQMTTARVHVEGGGETRVLVMGHTLQVGDEVVLTESLREDGAKRYSLVRSRLAE
ncbi:MAG TPA: hypothetical protein ENO09_07285 [bacterium]|nr:hypothetical protein [bacterium]